MGRKINLSMKELLEELPGLVITQDDFCYIFTNREKSIELVNLYNNSKNGVTIEKFFIDNESYIDKENLVLILARNYQKQLDVINQKIKNIENEEIQGLEMQSLQIEALEKQLSDKNALIEGIKTILRIGKGLEKIVTYYYYDKNEKRYKVSVLDSNEYIDGKHIGRSKNLRRFQKIDKEIKQKEDNDEKIGIDYVLLAINLYDIRDVFPNGQFGVDILSMIFDNKLIKEDKISLEKLRKMKNEDKDTYLNLLEKMEQRNIINELKQTLLDYIEYVNIDELLIRAGHSFNYALDRMDEEETKGYQEILEIILKNIENKKIKFSLYRNETEPEEFIEYAVKDLENCLKHFVNDTYISDTRIKEYRDKINDGDIQISQLDPDSLPLIFTKDELEEKAMLNAKNLKYISNILNWTEEEIISRIISKFEEGKISIDRISEFKKEINFENYITNQTLDEKYIKSIQEDSTLEDKLKYEKHVELYKEILLEDKTQEEQEDSYNNLMDFIIENYNGEEYIKIISNYYNNGLLSIDKILEWNGEELITRLLNDKIITLEEIKGLVDKGKLSTSYMNEICEQIVLNGDLSQEEVVETLIKWRAKKELIEKILTKSLIGKNNLDKLEQNRNIN